MTATKTMMRPQASPVDRAGPGPSRGIDSREFRRALGQFTTGVTIVATTEPNGTPRGFTASSFTSVSLNPPLILVCIGESAASCSIFCRAGGFSVNVLGADQRDHASLFATQRPDKFSITPWRRGASGMPLIEDSLAWFECDRYDVVEAGDHVILVGRVTDFGQRDGTPLAYVQGSFCCVDPVAPSPD